MPGEFHLIEWIRTQQTTSPLVELAAGDDLAILNWKWPGLLLVGVDQVLDGVHFDSSIHAPRAIGRKAMNRNLSDCAAMACRPAAALVSVALPRGGDIDYAKQLYLGIKEAAEPFDCPIVGGETGSWEGKLAVTVTILGRPGSRPPLTRRGASAGDLVIVTGALGGSRRGRHLTFTPRVELADAINAQGLASAMIDLSDGLSRDLRHLCDAGGVGAVIDADRVPIHEDAMAMPRDGRSPLEHALHDGEDYELLFACRRPIDTLPPMAGLENADLIRVGRFVAEPGVWLEKDGRREPLEPRGWEHPL